VVDSVMEAEAKAAAATKLRTARQSVSDALDAQFQGTR
jgi:hypothetical protein